MSLAADYVGKRVTVITVEGRHFIGTLESCDQLTNVVLSSCEERIYDMDSAPQVAPLGVYLLRGASVACIGAVDTIDEAQCNVMSLRGTQLPVCGLHA